MRRERQVAAIERLLGVVTRGAPEESLQESRLEVERYTSPARLADEKRALFKSLPIIVGRESDLPSNGSFFTHDDAGMPLLVTRDATGKVRAMLNVCSHRGTRLVTEASGSAKAFVCRYHAWTYDLGGKLGHVPLANCFPSLGAVGSSGRDESALTELPCATRHGFIWVLPTVGASLDVASWLGDFDDDHTSFALADHVVFRRKTTTRAANWKLVMDAFLEGYHVKSLHQRTLARFFGEEVVVDMSGDHVRSVGARKNLPELAATPRDAWDVRTCATVFFTLFPNSILVFHPETVSHIALFPHSVGEVTFVHTMLAPRAPATDEERTALDKTWTLIDEKVFGEEDLAIAESIQSVLHANAQPAFRLGVLEHPIRFFHDAMDRAIARTE
jgi:phenylpropionate dioxygenase-like ring-hydroxylating dioxygenase large terminal subunit